MFGLTKKNKEKKPEPATEEAATTVAYSVEDEVAIHVMPTRFKVMHQDSDQAKKTGLFILAGGSLVLLAGLGLGGYLLLKPKAKPVVVSTEITETASTTEQQPETPAPVVQEATLNNVASSTQPATTTEVVAQATTSVPVATTSSTSVIPGVDSDHDGLTDAEETLLGTNPNLNDSDGDGFYDYAEMIKGYNPAGAGKLIESSAVAIYKNENFSLAYMRALPFKASGNDQVVFTTPDNQLISVSLQPNIKNQTAAEWYKEQFGVTDIASDQLVQSLDANGVSYWLGVKSTDGLTYYLVDTKKQVIATINYNLGMSNVLNYPSILQFMVQSFRFK